MHSHIFLARLEELMHSHIFFDFGTHYHRPNEVNQGMLEINSCINLFLNYDLFFNVCRKSANIIVPRLVHERKTVIYESCNESQECNAAPTTVINLLA
jgi:hypothetical protein